MTNYRSSLKKEIGEVVDGTVDNIYDIVKALKEDCSGAIDLTEDGDLEDATDILYEMRDKIEKLYREVY